MLADYITYTKEPEDCTDQSCETDECCEFNGKRKVCVRQDLSINAGRLFRLASTSSSSCALLEGLDGRASLHNLILDTFNLNDTDLHDFSPAFNYDSGLPCLMEVCVRSFPWPLSYLQVEV